MKATIHNPVIDTLRSPSTHHVRDLWSNRFSSDTILSCKPMLHVWHLTSWHVYLTRPISDAVVKVEASHKVCLHHIIDEESIDPMVWDTDLHKGTSTLHCYYSLSDLQRTVLQIVYLNKIQLVQPILNLYYLHSQRALTVLIHRTERDASATQVKSTSNTKRIHIISGLNSFMFMHYITEYG